MARGCHIANDLNAHKDATLPSVVRTWSPLICLSRFVRYSENVGTSVLIGLSLRILPHFQVNFNHSPRARHSCLSPAFQKWLENPKCSFRPSIFDLTCSQRSELLPTQPGCTRPSSSPLTPSRNPLSLSNIGKLHRLIHLHPRIFLPLPHPPSQFLPKRLHNPSPRRIQYPPSLRNLPYLRHTNSRC